jgi:cobalt-zinc-cadmium efflux system protein
MHHHNPHHYDPAHSHHKSAVGTKNKLFLATAIILFFGCIEALGGWWSGSLTLLSDAGHMLADSISLALAGFAAWIASRPISKRHTYGLGRAEVIAAWFSCLSLIILTIFLLITAIRRFHGVHPVSGEIVMVIASFAFVTNLIVAWVLGHGEKTLNTKAALIHVLGDLLGAITALISGAIIHFTHWNLIDPILSIFIAILILISTVSLLRDSIIVLMEGVPKHIDIRKVEESMLKVINVISIHDLHIWTLTSGMVLLSAHVEIQDFTKWPEIAVELRTLLYDKFGINHATMQPENDSMPVCCKCD